MRGRRRVGHTQREGGHQNHRPTPMTPSNTPNTLSNPTTPATYTHKGSGRRGHGGSNTQVTNGRLAECSGKIVSLFPSPLP
ncbi:hypothetical protein E2C01_024396 [Portunus trituberculatus]|uniref:Uncharacterized protein n=1 Tax=Portunus trituberculatus TaxID=210409 RepID=A0A5B7ECP4_PORTR|nr:hypothetical protein [Portunus trituberculatus]